MSSLKDLASLIMVPSLYKDGELHTVKPLGNSILHPDATGNHDGTDGSTPAEGNFTFSRGSNLAATRVDVNGLIEKGRENLITYSNEFDNASGWTQYSGYTLTSGQADKDGGTNAWKWESTQSGTAQINNVHNQTGMVTHSIYAKAGNIDVLKIWVGVTAEFNLSTGVASHSQSKMTDVGNGWWRCEIFSPYTRFNPFFSPTASGQYLYIQDAQAEQGLVATDYIETGASTAQAGILEDMPRLDYSGSCPALLLEPQRTNLLEQGEYYNAYYTRDGVSVTDNALTSPEGLQNASKLVEDSANSKHRIGKATFPSGTQRTLSVFAKAGERNYISLFENNAVGSDVKGAIFNLSNGTLSINNSPTYYSNPTIEPIGSSGWYRCSVTWTATSLSVPSFGVSADGLENTYQGDGSSGIYIYGAQLEEGSYPTSYIPTYGSSVTRSYDNQDVTGLFANVFNNDDLTLFYDFDYNADGREGSTTAYRIFSGSSQLGIKGTSNTARSLQIFSSGNFSGTINFNGAEATRIKVALRITNGTCELFFNGAKDTETIDVSGAAPYTWGQITMLASSSLNTSLNQCVGFPTALTDSECIALTTL